MVLLLQIYIFWNCVFDLTQGGFLPLVNSLTVYHYLHLTLRYVAYSVSHTAFSCVNDELHISYFNSLKTLFFQLVMEFCGAGSVTDLVKGKIDILKIQMFIFFYM